MQCNATAALLVSDIKQRELITLNYSLRLEHEVVLHRPTTMSICKPKVGRFVNLDVGQMGHGQDRGVAMMGRDPILGEAHWGIKEAWPL